MKKDSGTRF